MIDDHQAPDRIAEALVRLARTAQNEDGGSQLTSAQCACLRFFVRANSSMRTPSSFANFQAKTHGNAAYCTCLSAELAIEEINTLCASCSGPAREVAERRKPI